MKVQYMKVQVQSTLPERLLNKGFCFGHLKYCSYYHIIFWGGKDYIIIGKIGDILYTGRKYIPIKKFLGDIDSIALIKLKDITFVNTDSPTDFPRKNSFEVLSKLTEQRTNKGLGKQEIKNWIDHLRDIEELNPANLHHDITIWV